MSCAKFIGMHVKEVAEAAPTDALGPILTQAAEYAGGGTLREFKGDLKEIMRQLGLSTQDAQFANRWGSASYQALVSNIYFKTVSLSEDGDSRLLYM